MIFGFGSGADKYYQYMSAPEFKTLLDSVHYPTAMGRTYFASCSQTRLEAGHTPSSKWKLFNDLYHDELHLAELHEELSRFEAHFLLSVMVSAWTAFGAESLAARHSKLQSLGNRACATDTETLRESGMRDSSMRESSMRDSSMRESGLRESNFSASWVGSDVMSANIKPVLPPLVNLEAVQLYTIAVDDLESSGRPQLLPKPMAAAEREGYSALYIKAVQGPESILSSVLAGITKLKGDFELLVNYLAVPLMPGSDSQVQSGSDYKQLQDNRQLVSQDKWSDIFGDLAEGRTVVDLFNRCAALESGVLVQPRTC